MHSTKVLALGMFALKVIANEATVTVTVSDCGAAPSYPVSTPIGSIPVTSTSIETTPSAEVPGTLTLSLSLVETPTPLITYPGSSGLTTVPTSIEVDTSSVVNSTSVIITPTATPSKTTTSNSTSTIATPSESTTAASGAEVNDVSYALALAGLAGGVLILV